MNTPDFSSDLKKALKRKNITQQALAHLSGVSQSNICKIIKGKTFLRFATILALWPHIYDAPFPEINITTTAGREKEDA